MKVIIVGCGNIGSALLLSMLKEGHDVTVIDTKENVVEDIINKYDIMAICGNATSYDLLTRAGVADCDLFISLTNSDEFNMLSAFIAKKLGARHTVARVRESNYSSPDFDFIQTQLGISMTINPELKTAEVLYNILSIPAATNVETFSSGGFEILELSISEGQNIIGKSLFEIKKNCPVNFLVCVVQRGDEVFVPNGVFSLKQGDKIGVISSHADSNKLLKFLDFEQLNVKNVLLVGASNISYYLAKSLVYNKHSVTIIDKDIEKCNAISEKLDGTASVIHGNGMLKDLLLEMGISSKTALVTLTGEDEQNILISYTAKELNCEKAITKIDELELKEISQKIGLDCVISPKEVVADILVRYARAIQGADGNKIETLYSLMNGTSEAVEFIVLPDFKYTNIPLKDLQFAQNVIIAGIIRNGENVIPDGNDVILSGDKVIAITTNKSLYDLSDIIRRK